MWHCMGWVAQLCIAWLHFMSVHTFKSCLLLLTCCDLQWPHQYSVLGTESNAVSNSQRREAAQRRQAAEIDANMERLLETASSGGMSTGLEFDVTADNSTGSVVQVMQGQRGGADAEAVALPVLE